MQQIMLDEKWTFRRGMLDSIGMLEVDPGKAVDLPHDGMIQPFCFQRSSGKCRFRIFSGRYL